MEDICAQCKEQREKLYWNAVPGNKHHFVKPMLNDFRNTLKIPRKFTDEFQGELSETVTLQGPSGNNWTTTFAERGKDFVLINGWKHFVQDHSLNEGDLLVFRHVEDSVFDVLIFDDSGCEKEASHFVGKDGKFQVDSCCSVHQVKKSKNGKHLEQKDEEENSDSEEIEQDSSGTNLRTERPMRYSMYYESNRKAITEKDKKSAFAKASKFQPKNPSCMIRLKPSHVHHLFILTIPREFAANCLPKTSQTIMLRNNSKTWKVKLNRRNVQCTLTKGWAKFVLENTLETEDMCVLELANTGTSKKPTLLDVHIFRVVEKTVPLKVVRPLSSFMVM